MLTANSLKLNSQNSPYTVSKTIERLQKALQARGNNIFALIDHSEGAKKVNMELSEAKVVIFGDPKIGTYLMQENPLIGIELPLRILILQNDKKETQIVYIDPISLGESYGIVKNAEILKKMSAGLSNIIDEVISP